MIILNEKEKINNKIVILGVFCVGKTTLGKIIADKLSYKFIESDQEII